MLRFLIYSTIYLSTDYTYFMKNKPPILIFRSTLKGDFKRGSIFSMPKFYEIY